MKLNSQGTNAKIKAHILPEEEMRKLGFTDYDEENWYYFKLLDKDVSFNITIPKNGSDIEIITLDESFLQPYDYQSILKNSPNHMFALSIQEKVEELMGFFKENGVLSGHKKGDYI